jgi:hypothetical protein
LIICGTNTRVVAAQSASDDPDIPDMKTLVSTFT